MTIIIKKVDITPLTTNNQFDYLLVGDGSLCSITERIAWASFVISANGTGEVLYGLESVRGDIHLAEIAPCLGTMRTIRNRQLISGPFKNRLLVISDNRNLVAQSTNKGHNYYTGGAWNEIRSYTEFDVYWEYRKRRSNKLLEFVDDICGILKSSHESVDDKVRKFCRQKAQSLILKE